MLILKRHILVCLFLTTCAALGQVAFKKGEGQMEISINGESFATYVWNDPETTRPYFKQVHEPDEGIQVTRNHPPKADDFSDHDTYHPGIWWGFGDVGGNDYWRMKAKIIGGTFIEEPRGGKDRGTFAVRNQLLTNEGTETFCEQVCRYTLLNRPHGILLICESTFRREESDFWLGDQEEMGLAFRVATPIAVASRKGGRILDSEGRTDLKEIRTNQSDWCDYSGPIEGEYAGIMIMNDPANFRKPWWHAVDTGLLIANPLGESELNGRGKRKQNVLVKKGEPFRLRYGVFIHAHGEANEFDPAFAYKDFLSAIGSTPARQSLSRSQLPKVPAGFEVRVFAREPMIYKPTAICFDAKGRMMLGQGPQYPRNLEDTPADSVLLLIDKDGDGTADVSKRFAVGFNSIQGLAWKGNDLYVANAPELTVVRDLDGDDEADEYVMVYTDLGNREHALHGLNWGPDGKLYMSKGNSKGHNQPEKYGYLAPRPFRELWDVVHPPGAPDFYPPKTFTKETYKKTYHHWDDDWGREGGVLRCDPLGANLEIVSRGLRNPWDMTMDDGFNWLGTDNDQNQGDRIIMPFFGAHFGWGHSYSSHWTGENHPPTAPVSGPVFPGSGTGIIYYTHQQFPEEYRNVFFMNDWLNGTYVYRPSWDGALMQPNGGRWEPFAQRGAMLYRPTDMEFGPDGTIYTCGWGGDYHYEPGSVGSWILRIVYTGQPIAPRTEWFPKKRSLPYAEWSVDQLLDDLNHDVLPVWRVNAQDELVRRGDQVRGPLIELIKSGGLSRGQETWAIWAVGRMAPNDESIDAAMSKLARSMVPTHLNLRLQALRILAYRIRNHRAEGRLPEGIVVALMDPEPRVRFEAVQAIWQAKQTHMRSALIDWLAQEEDRLVFYAGWGALRDLSDVAFRKQLLNDDRPNVRLAALLSLLERHDMRLEEVLALAEKDPDPRIQQWSTTWAMNPRPPRKMPNSTTRIVLEQSVSVDDLMKRANEARSPKMRHLYLTMLSRATYEEDDEWRDIQNFYKGLSQDDERALVLTPLARETDAMPLLWDALGRNEKLGRSAVNGLLSLAKRAQSSPEQVGGFLLAKLQESSGQHQQDRAIETLSRLPFSSAWSPPDLEKIDIPKVAAKVVELDVASAKQTVAFAGGLNAGAKIYLDRGHRFTNVPEHLKGATYLMTSNEDAGSLGDDLAKFTTLYAMDVYIAHDDRIRSADKPKWLGRFTRTDIKLSTDDAEFTLFQERLKKGATFVVGGNSTDGRDGGKSNYTVIFKPVLTDLQPESAAAADVLPALDQAEGWDGILSHIFETCEDVQTQTRILDILLGFDANDLGQSDLVKRLLARASKQPDSRLFGRLLQLNSQLGIEVAMTPLEPATIDGVLALTDRADADRGRELIFGSKTAAACLICHRIQGQGQNLGPDLSGIGLRSDLKTIIQSIVEPSAVITEGYRLQVIETDVSTISGAVLQETDSVILLVTQQGTLERIEVGSIKSRQTLDQSSMPATFSVILGNEQIADLAAFLLTCRHPSGESTN